ncbi:hypothetical protein [Piscinibacterium candidicorallinum]|uniref:CAAX protease self-immunity n=1 Tax=Piscinibacterium candidicorallinum TaxID=1793872 RepID=A0ABV7H983_9BURK
MNVLDEARRFFAFLQSPSATRRLEALDTRQSARLLVLAALVLAAVYAVAVPFQQRVAIAHGATNLFDDGSIPQGVIITLALVMVPIEELIFRLWMRRPRALPLCAGGAALLMTLSFGPAGQMTNWLAFGAFGMGCVIWARVRKLPPDGPYEAWLSRHFGLWVWGSILLFAGLHLSNWTVDTLSPAVLALVLPQLALGLMASFVCLRAGFRWAVALHFANNLFALTL